MNRFIVSKDNQRQRIDKFLVDYYEDESRSQIQKWITEGYARVNGKRVKSNYKIEYNDEIIVTVPEETAILPFAQDIHVPVVYEDDYLMVINKPKGMSVHPASHDETGTLAHAMMHHSKKLSRFAGEHRPGIVHRIDKDTSGLLVIAKEDWIHEDLAEQFKSRQVVRLYEAIVHGDVFHERGMIDAPIGRDPHHRTKMTVIEHGKQAQTKFQVVERFIDYTILQCELLTGRTHQIRVHMAYINHPIVDDERYGGKRIIGEGQALFAKSLTFTHPSSKERLTFTIERPKLYEKIIKKINETP
ncbi:MAG TPA: RluA family pseudouridine synthase [Bacillota bacterium]|nr:RluA family pseudouridine synthase [Bacillota bacterium]